MPPPKAPVGSSCTTDSSCSTGFCAASWPDGYCTRSCTIGDDCGPGAVCLHYLDTEIRSCLSVCAVPGSRSTCRSGYRCSPFAGTRTDGFCELEPKSSGAGGGSGGGGSGGSAGGGGGGAGLPTRINYKVTAFQGTYSGNAVHYVSASQMDILATNSCTYSSTGTPSTQVAFIGLSSSTPSLTITGQVTCPPGMATSTAGTSCTTQVTSGSPLFEWTINVAGWADDSVVTLEARYTPGMIPACNSATVLYDGWGIAATTTVQKFRNGTAFPIHFVGARSLGTSYNSSDVSWDFTMTIQPL